MVGKPRTDERLVELRDVMPTFLSLAGAPVPPTVEGESILAPNPDRPYLHGEHLFEEDSVQFIVTKEDKFIWFSSQMKEQYFRLDIDPEERVNRIHAPEYQERIAQMRLWLAQELEGREEGFSDGHQLLSGSRPRATASWLES